MARWYQDLAGQSLGQMEPVPALADEPPGPEPRPPEPDSEPEPEPDDDRSWYSQLAFPADTAPPTAGERLGAAGGYLARGLAAAPAAVTDTAALLARGVGKVIGHEPPPEADEALGDIRSAFGAGEESMAAVEPHLEDAGLIEKVLQRGLPSAIGSAASMLTGAGALGGGARAVGGVGAMMESTSLLYEARAAGADPTGQAMAFATGLPLGYLERFGIGRALGTANKATGGRLMARIGREMVREGGEEVVQEFIQNVGENLVASQYWDPERGLLDDVPEAALSALVLGSAVGGAAGAIGESRGRTEAPRASYAEDLPEGHVAPEGVYPDLAGVGEVSEGAATVPEASPPTEQAAVEGQDPSVAPADQPEPGGATGTTTAATPPKEVSAFPGGLLEIPALRRFSSELKRNLTSRGNLPSDAFEANVRRTAEANAEIQDIHFHLRDFHRTVKEELGRDPSDLPPAMLARFDQVLKGGTAETIPPRVRKALDNMRQSIDRMSRRLIDSGAIEGDLIPHVQGNLGFYVTRSYQVFDDPNWADKVSEEVRNKAKALIRKEFEQNAARTRKVYAKRARLARERARLARLRAENAKNPEKHLAQANRHELHAIDMVNRPRLVRRKLSEEEVNGKIASLLYEGKAAQGPIALLKQAKLGAKDLSILKRRKEIAPEIRALFGEYKDPRINYAKSVLRMAHLIANQKFLETLKHEGLGHWLHEAPIVRNGVEYKTRIAADESSVMSPLNGLYTTPEIEQAFRDATEASVINSDLLRLYLGIQSTAKLSKTVGSVVTAQRNLFGNIGFALAQGHWRAWLASPAAKSVGVKWGITDTLTDFAARLDSLPVQEWRAYYKHLLELGVIHESTRAGEMRDMMKDAAGADDSMSWLDSRLKRAIKMPLRAAIEYYRAGDDIPKVYAFENEKARYRKAKPNMPEAELDRIAAWIVRNTYPTYSQVPRAVRLLRRLPFGPFLSFPAEVLRVSKNTALLIKSEMADPDLRGIAAQRLVGSTLAATVPAAVAVGLRFMLGITAEDDEDRREFVAPWSKRNELWWIQNGEEGKGRYIDISYTDPWHYLKTPIYALMREESIDEAAVAAMTEAFEPLLGEEIMVGAIIDVLRNKKKSSGAPVYNEQASPTRQADQIGEHLAEAVTPGTVDLIRRVNMGLNDETTDYGRSYDPKVEAIAAFTGLRVTDVDPLQAFSFKAGDFNDAKRQAARILTGTLKRQNTVTDEEILEAYRETEVARQGAFEELSAAYRAGRNMGLEDEQIFAALDKLGKRDLAYLSEGVYPPYVPSRQTVSDMVTLLGEEETERRLRLVEQALVAAEAEIAD